MALSSHRRGDQAPAARWTRARTYRLEGPSKIQPDVVHTGCRGGSFARVWKSALLESIAAHPRCLLSRAGAQK